MANYLSVLGSILKISGIFFLFPRAEYNAGAAGIPRIKSHRRTGPVQPLCFRPHVQALLGMACQSSIP